MNFELIYILFQIHLNKNIFCSILFIIMTHSCTDVFYHSRHTALILFLFIFSYIYSLYQCYLFCRPLIELRINKTSNFSISDSEILHAIIFTLGFTMTLTIDYYLIRPSFGVCLMIFLFYLYERFSAKSHIIMILLIDLIGIAFIFYLQGECYVKTLVFLRIILEILKLITTFWSNNYLRIHKSGGVHLVGLSLLVSWIIFFMLRR